MGVAAGRGRAALIRLRLLIFLGLVSLTPRVAASPDQRVASELAWVAPSQARVARFFQSTRPGAFRHVDARGWLSLEAGEYLIVPVRPGDRVRVSARHAQLGLGTGYDELPDVVTWQKVLRSVPLEWRVPGYSSARFVVVKPLTKATSSVRVWLAAPLEDPLAWYRADDLVADFIDGDDQALPRLPPAVREAEPILRWLGAARQALSKPTLSSTAKHWLQARWLALSMQHRPLHRPFFQPEPISLTGGKVWSETATEVPPDQEPPRLLATGDKLAIAGASPHLVSLLVRPRARGVTRYSVYAGDELVYRVEASVPQRGERQGFLAPRLHRVVPPEAGGLSVAVEEGRLLIEARGYSLNTSIFDFSARRNPRRLLGSRAAGGSYLSALLMSERQRSNQAQQVLAAALAGVPDSEPSLKALLLHEDLLHQLGSPDVIERLEALWRSSKTLPDTVRLPLRRSALAALLDVSTSVLDKPVELPEAPANQDGPPRSAAERERALIAAYRATLAPKRDGLGPRQAVRTERWAAASPDPGLSALADQVWAREAVFKTLESHSSESTERLTQVAALGSCNARGPGGLRWLSAEPEQTLLLKALGGTHSRLQIQGQPGAPLADAVIAIDDAQFSVHAGAELATSLAVRPGPHRFRQLSGEQLLLRYETDSEFPCNRLYDQERWVILDGVADFSVPRGLGESVLSVSVAEESLGAAAEIQVDLAGVSHRASFEGRASGTAEFRVPQGLDYIQLASDRRLLVRARVKQRRTGFGRPVEQKPVSTEPIVPQSIWLERLRSATRRLRSAGSDTARGEHRRSRIIALQRLGYLRLAGVDRGRLEEAQHPPEPGPLPFMALRLPPTAKPVEAIGMLPLIPALPQPEPGDWFEALLKARLRGLEWSAALETLERRSRHSTAVDALLLARLAEQAQELAVAQAAWLRLSQAHESGALLREAARVTTDIAARSLDRDQTLRAYMLTLKAARRGADVDALLGRMNASVQWLGVEAEQLSRAVWLEHERHVADDEPLALSVRRALTDAPDNSVLLTHAPAVFFTSRFEGRLVQVDALCHALSGAKENCPLEVRVDGERVACVPVGRQDKRAFEVRRMAPEVARPLGCRVELPEGAERLSVQLAPPSGAALGWAVAREVTPTGLAPSSYSARWLQADAGHAVGTWLAGPAVLRIEARAASEAASGLVVRLEPVAGNGRSIERTIATPATLDRYATFAEGDEPVFAPTRAEVLVEQPGRYRLNVMPLAGSVLLRLSLSNVVAPPRSQTLADDDLDELDPPLHEALKPWPGVRVGFDPVPGALTLGASLAARSADLIEGDRDPATRYLELGVQARRALVERLLWGAMGVFQRQRVGPESHGVELGLWLTSDAGWPGAFTRLTAVTQRLAGEQLLGYYTVLGVYYPFELGQKLRFVPTTQAVVRRVAASAAGKHAADRVVYSPYADSRPHSFDLLGRLDYRAFVDFTLRGETRARAAPYLDGWDRFDVSVTSDLLTGGGWSPWLQSELLASHRPVSPQRERAFSRFAASQSVVFWRWLTSAQRVTLSIGGSYFFDVPRTYERSSAFSGELALGYEYSFERGLADLNLGQRPFRARQEEARPALPRRGVGAHPYWSE